MTWKPEQITVSEAELEAFDNAILEGASNAILEGSSDDYLRQALAAFHAARMPERSSLENVDRQWNAALDAVAKGKGT
jgi:hypothetical protein